MRLLRIKNWNDTHENSRSRACDTLHWVSIPNAFDTPGYIRMVAGKDGAAIWGAWCAMVMLASRPKDRARRGCLVDDTGTPYTAEDIASITRLPVKTITAAIERARSPSVGWLEEVVVPDMQATPDRQPGDGRVTGDCQPGDGRVTGGRRATDEGKEGRKGEEGRYISAVASSPVALAVKAVDAWAEKRRGYGLKAANNEHRTVEDWADALMDAPPVIRGGQQVSPLLLVPEAARAHVEKGTDFKHVRYALRCLEGTLDEWRRNGVGGAPSAGRFTDADIERLIPGGDAA
jgi:hypothetical protein